MNKTLLCIVAGFSLLSASVLAQSEQAVRKKTFMDWWLTPEQQAARAWEKGDNDKLTSIAPNNEWRGAAAYRSENYDQALEAFKARDGEPLGLRELYNEATTNIQLGDYANAIAQLEEVLAEQPENANAVRNRDIAVRLLELEQQSQQNENGEGGDGESGDEQQSSEEGEQSDTDSQSENGESSESESGEQDSEQPQADESSGEPESGESDEGEPNENSDDASDEGTTSEEEREAEIDAAREALQAAAEESAKDAEQDQSETMAGSLSDEPLSEEDQATEQWLRQIPDDPDDLLRRKLLQNHRNEYPNVQRNGRGY